MWEQILLIELFLSYSQPSTNKFAVFNANCNSSSVNESSERFDFHFDPFKNHNLASEGSKCEFEFEYEFDEKTKSYEIFGKLRLFVENLVAEINSMKLSQTQIKNHETIVEFSR